MKKRILALLSVAVLVISMTATVFAAESPSADVIGSTGSGQTITPETLASFLSTTTISTDVAGATIAQVATNDAASLVTAANSQVGANASIATMVDIKVPAGTGTANFTLNVGNLVAGQAVTVLHLKSDGTVEKLPVTSVKNGSVTFTMSSYSPVAVVVNATAPKTGEPSMAMVMVMAMAALAGAAFCGYKYAR